MVLLVFNLIHAKNRHVPVILQYEHSSAISVCKLVPFSSAEKAGLVEASGEICTQTISQRNELKKIYSFNCTAIFQTHALHFTDQELIHCSKLFPTVPLYILCCTILI